MYAILPDPALYLAPDLAFCHPCSLAIQGFGDPARRVFSCAAHYIALTLGIDFLIPASTAENPIRFFHS